MSTTKWFSAAHKHAEGNVAEAMRYLNGMQRHDPEAGCALRVMRSRARKHPTAVRFEMHKSAFVAFIDEPPAKRDPVDVAERRLAHVQDELREFDRLNPNPTGNLRGIFAGAVESAENALTQVASEQRIEAAITAIDASATRTMETWERIAERLSACARATAWRRSRAVASSRET